MTSNAATPLRPISLPFAVTPRRAGGAHADLSTLTLAHRATCSGTRMLADAVAAVAAGADCPPERHEAIVWFTGFVLDEITAHHKVEDDILWPVIAVSVGPDVDLDALSDEHGVLDSLLHRVRDALRTFTMRCGVGAPTLATALGELADDLDEHIAEEEATLFPIIDKYVSAADFARCSNQFGRQNSPAHQRFARSWFSDHDPEAGVHLSLRARLGRRRHHAQWLRRRDLIAAVASWSVRDRSAQSGLS